MDLTTLLTKLFEYAPAVAILLYLNWRMDRTLGRVIDWCLDRDDDDDDEKK
jgi:hypothetical protein